MLPSVADQYISEGGRANRIPSQDLAPRVIPRRVHLAHRSHVINSDARVFSQSLAGLSILRVLSGSTWNQVRRIATWRIIAGMANDEPFGDRSYGKLISDAMSRRRAPCMTISECAVSVLVATSPPFPAIAVRPLTGGFIYLIPKPLRKRTALQWMAYPDIMPRDIAIWLACFGVAIYRLAAPALARLDETQFGFNDGDSHAVHSLIVNSLVRLVRVLPAP